MTAHTCLGCNQKTTGPGLCDKCEDDEKCFECGADTDDGEGFDGRCGECADRRHVVLAERLAKREGWSLHSDGSFRKGRRKLDLGGSWDELCYAEDIDIYEDDE